LILRRGLLFCNILGLVLGGIVCTRSLDSALGATGPAGGALIEPTIDRPTADPAPNATTPRKPVPRAQSGNPLWGIPLKALNNTRERPLFSPSRRPPPTAVVAAPPAPVQQPPQPAAPDHPPLTIVGTIVGETQSIGVFVDQATKEIVRLKTGEGHAGWTLRTIHGREAILEKDQREATLVLPARGATEQATASVPATTSTTTRPADARSADPGQPITSKPPISTQADAKPSALSPSTWVDGDGQLIARPRSASMHADAKADLPALAAWVDGDGQSATPPPASPKLGPDGKPLGPSVWLDGYGRPIGPAPTVWQDGDAQSISPPPYPWTDEDGNPTVPPAAAWPDGDGQLISPPLPRMRQGAAR